VHTNVPYVVVDISIRYCSYFLFFSLDGTDAGRYADFTS